MHTVVATGPSEVIVFLISSARHRGMIILLLAREDIFNIRMLTAGVSPKKKIRY